MKIHLLQHDPEEGLGSIEDWAKAHEHTLTVTRFFADEALPTMDAFDWLIIMGGPMNVYEVVEHPWLIAEKKFIRQAIRENKIVLGVCLGAQLISDVMGGPVRRNEQSEIGWFPVQLTEEGKQSALLADLPQEFTVLHWHGDTFALPPGAVHLARSAGCANQAFSIGNRVLGLQFHLEFTPEVARDMLNSGEPLGQDTYIQRSEEILEQPERFSDSHKLMHAILDRLAQSS